MEPCRYIVQSEDGPGIFRLGFLEWINPDGHTACGMREDHIITRLPSVVSENGKRGNLIHVSQ